MTTARAVSHHVDSPDGTRIAVHVSGRGRPLIVVPGTTSDHTAWQLVLPFLEEHVTVHAVDRRGRGGSGDGPDYSITREYADVAAVIDAAATSAGRRVDVLGHSYGGTVAFGAATHTTNIRKLVLYEGWPPPNPADRTFPADIVAELTTSIARGRPEQALETFYREMVKIDDIDALKASPAWPARVAAAHTIPRELAAFAADAFEPGRAAKIRVPVLLLVGEHTPAGLRADPDIVAAALPDARIRVLGGQAHIAHLTAPETFAAELLSFLRG